MNKILKDLQSHSEKIIILALMYIPRLKPQFNYKLENLNLMRDLLCEYQNSTNPDISFLSAKAINFLNRNWPETLQPIINQVPYSEPENTLKELTNSEPDISEIHTTATEINPDNHRSDLHFNQLESQNRLRDENPRVRSAAIEECCQIYNSEQLVKIISPLLKDDNNRVRANAIVALKDSDHTLLTPCLLEMLESPRISMRESAIWALSKLPTHKQYCEFLLKALYDPYRDIRIRSIRALISYSDDLVSMQMKRLAQDPDEEIRLEAANTLQQIRKINLYVTENQAIELENSLQRNNLSTDRIDDNQSISIDNNFFDLDKKNSESSMNQIRSSNESNKSIKTKDLSFSMGNITKIQHKIELHQKLNSISVEEFFNHYESNQDVDSRRMKEEYWETPEPNLDILSWIPMGYLPEKYSAETNETSLSSDSQSDLHQKINQLLLQIGQRCFSYHKTCKVTNTVLDQHYEKILEIREKSQKLKLNHDIHANRKLQLTQRLQEDLRETLIKLGKVTLQQFNQNAIDFEGLREYQLHLNQLVRNRSDQSSKER